MPPLHPATTECPWSTIARRTRAISSHTAHRIPLRSWIRSSTIYSTVCSTLYSVQCTLYSVQCTAVFTVLQTVDCTVHLSFGLLPTVSPTVLCIKPHKPQSDKQGIQLWISAGDDCCTVLFFFIYCTQCSVVQWGAVQCSAVQCSAVQCSAVQCSAVKWNTIQFSAISLAVLGTDDGNHCGDN